MPRMTQNISASSTSAVRIPESLVRCEDSNRHDRIDDWLDHHFRVQCRTGKTISSGAFATIKEAIHTKTRKCYAIEVISKKKLMGMEHMVSPVLTSHIIVIIPSGKGPTMYWSMFQLNYVRYAMGSPRSGWFRGTRMSSHSMITSRCAYLFIGGKSDLMTWLAH